MTRTAKLTKEAKEFVVRALACFDTPSTVVEAVRKEFGVQISRQTVEGYDPTKRAGHKLAEKWKTIFDATRQSFLQDLSGIAIAHRAVRLRALARMATKAEEAGNFALAVTVYETAAKEVGEAYTNRRQLSGPKDGPLRVQASSTVYPSSTTAAAELYRQMLHDNPWP